MGSWHEAAQLAAGKLVELGCTRLEAAVGGYIARFGDVCWQTDGKLQLELRRPDGKRYHVESIARARRALRDRGLIQSTRVFMGAKIPGAKYASARGTTLKTFNWRAVCEKNPLSRRQRRRARQEQAAEARAAGELVPARPRYSGVTTAIDPTYTPPISDPALAAQVEATTRALERHWTMGAARPAPVRAAAVERAPPDD